MNNTNHTRVYQKAGFTLVEILVTTAIIGILIGIVMGIAGIASKKSDENKARAEMQKISNAIEEYKINYGGYPTYSGALDATDNTAQQIRKALTNDMPNRVLDLKFTDPWGRGFLYESTTRHTYTLYSEGPNKGTNVDNLDSVTF